MYAQAIKAKYINGMLQLMDKINLTDGEEVMLQINQSNNLDNESRVWLDSSLAGELLPFNWGKGGAPQTIPVSYKPGRGFNIKE